MPFQKREVAVSPGHLDGVQEYYVVDEITEPARRVEGHSAWGWIKQGGKIGNGVRRFLKRRRKEEKKMTQENYTPGAVVDLEVYDAARNSRKGNRAVVTSGVALVVFGIARTAIDYGIGAILPEEIARTIDEPTKDWAANIAAVFVAGLAAKGWAQAKNYWDTRNMPRPGTNGGH